jgi:hypothetical protein
MTINPGVTPVTNENGTEILVVDPAHLGDFLAAIGSTADLDTRSGPGLLTDAERALRAEPKPVRTVAAEFRPLWEIAREIAADWGNPNYAALPYLEVMFKLDKITDRYGYDDAEEIVLKFLGNAKTWRGDTARLVKAELRQMLEAAR